MTNNAWWRNVLDSMMLVYYVFSISTYVINTNNYILYILCYLNRQNVCLSSKRETNYFQ